MGVINDGLGEESADEKGLHVHGSWVHEGQGSVAFQFVPDWFESGVPGEEVTVRGVDRHADSLFLGRVDIVDLFEGAINISSIRKDAKEAQAQWMFVHEVGEIIVCFSAEITGLLTGVSDGNYLVLRPRAPLEQIQSNPGSPKCLFQTNSEWESQMDHRQPPQQHSCNLAEGREYGYSSDTRPCCL